MNKPIRESGMDFVRDNAFYIEKSCQFRHIGAGIRTVEFVRVDKGKLMFVEAKKDFKKSDEKYFENKIDDICEKFVHSLALYASIAVGVACPFPVCYTPQGKLSLLMILVIREHEVEQCRDVEGALKARLKAMLPDYIMTIWDPKVLVFNREDAIENGLVIG